MLEDKILKLWQQGYSKYEIAKIYRRNYNQQIKIIRLELVNRHFGKFISNKEALAVVENIIYKEIKK